MRECRCTKYAGKPPCIHDYASAVAELAAGIAAVRELHYDDGDGWCNHCGHRKYPCRTIQVLDGEVDTPNDLVSTLTANADITETSANADTGCQNDNESVAEPALAGEQE